MGAPKAVLLLCVSLALSRVAVAQSGAGTIRGIVLDPHARPVAGAAVRAVDAASGVARTVATEAGGDFEAAQLRPGSYRIEVTASGFKAHIRSGIILKAASTIRVDVQLEMGARHEQVTVSADGAITVDSPALALGLDEQQVRDLPRGGRDIQDFLVLSPNVVGGHEALQFLGGRSYGVSYTQDGQPSSGLIFGDVGSAAPSLDAVAELQVLSNAYAAEYGGLAGVVVTTRRGGSSRHGGGFYDFGADELNALTYSQKLAGTQRGAPQSDTHDHRFGVHLGGPLRAERSFFFLSYEGGRQRQIGGGERAIVPAAAMRNGDFSAASFIIRDPATGVPFPGNVIPADRIDPAARAITDFFYPLPNQRILPSGFGVFQQFVPLDRRRDRADLRTDHELTSRDSLFGRASWQRRDPDAFTFEAGSALTQLGILDRRAQALTLVAGWTRVLSQGAVNELRFGYNLHDSRRRSQFVAGPVADQLGIEVPAGAREARGFPTFIFSGANRPTSIQDQRQNAFRDLREETFSASETLNMVAGRHSVKLGAIFTRNAARDGYSTGANEAKGRYDFGTLTGNSYADFLLGIPSRVREQRNTRLDEPLDATSHDFAFFLQDDWRVRSDLTLFLGLRYDRIGYYRDRNRLFANFDTRDGGHHVVTDPGVAALLPPGAQALDRTRFASDLGLGPELIRPDTNNLSPRLGFAYRAGAQGVLRGGFGLFRPFGAAQGARDLMSRNPFRYFITRRGATLSHGFSTGTVIEDLSFGNQGIAFDLESPDVYQYHLTLERDLGRGFGLRASYLGATYRKLIVLRDHNTVEASAVPLGDVEVDPAARMRLPYPLYTPFMDVAENTGEGQFHALQLELSRRFRGGFGLQAVYTLAGTDGNAPDTGSSSLGVIQYDPYDIEKDRGPDPNVPRQRALVNATWELPVGRGRGHGGDLPGWANALLGGWTVSAIFQARSGHYLTPFFTYGTDPIYPANTGRSLDGVGCFCEAWRPDQVGDPSPGGSRDAFFDVSAYRLPAPGTLGTAKRGSLVGPGTWVLNLAFYKDVLTSRRVKAQISVLLENALNHPQFFVDDLGVSGFVDLTDFLVNGIEDNGTTAVLGAGTVGSAEGFSPGRVVRLGVRVTF